MRDRIFKLSSSDFSNLTNTLNSLNSSNWMKILLRLGITSKLLIFEKLINRNHWTISCCYFSLLWRQRMRRVDPSGAHRVRRNDWQLCSITVQSTRFLAGSLAAANRPHAHFAAVMSNTGSPLKACHNIWFSRIELGFFSSSCERQIIMTPSRETKTRPR